MRAVLSRGLLGSLLTLISVTVCIFIFLRAIPGDVVVMVLGSDVRFQAAEHRLQIERELGLDKPLVLQYFDWAGKALRGDLGRSLFSGHSVWEEVRGRLPVTIELAFMALLVSAVVGVGLGTLAAVFSGTWLDGLIRVVAIMKLCVPTFWLGTLVLVFGARWFGWIPPAVYVSPLDDPQRNLEQFAVPATVLGLTLAGSMSRLSRSSLLEVLREDFVRTARSKGLPERLVVLRHVMRNGVLPVVTLFGLQAAGVMAGSIVVERVFNLPGMGRLLLDGIARRDYPLVQGIILLYVVFIIVLNLVIEVVYGALDPRVREQRA
jgi:peptide/nickel transport system permease protein